MSWWNSSNFTDLASKALKNAQKKIDKALDISEDGKAKEGTISAPVTSEKKETGDSWSGWLGETQETESQSSWSFPWGSGAGGEQEKETENLVKEKTAEEIKNEVLKAAKERTKAKSKLFPQKSKKEKIVEDKNQERDSLVEENTPESSFEESNKRLEDSNLNKDTTESLVLSSTNYGQESSGSPEDSDIPEKDENVIDVKSPSSKGIEDSEPVITESTNDEAEKEETAHQNVSEEGADYGTNDTCGELSGGQKTSLSEIDQSSPKSSRDLKDINTDDASKFEESVLSLKELAVKVDDSGLEFNVNTFNEDHFSLKSDLLKLSEDALNTEDEISDVKKSKIVEENTESTIISKVTNESVVLKKTLDESSDMLCVDDSVATDISSSVEFVTKSDIPTFDENTGKEEDIYDQSSSDSEIVDCDKISTGSSMKQGSLENEVLCQEEFQTVIKSESFCEEMLQTEVTDIVVKGESLLIIDPGYDDSSPVIQSEITCTEPEKLFPGSDSESSVSKLDISMDTCTSEETVVDPGSGQDENEKPSSPLTDQTTTSSITTGTTNQDQSQETSLNVAESEEQNSAKKSDGNSDEAKENDKLELSPSNSFVKCMLEDAIDDGKQDDNSDSLSATEKSEGSRSVYSNHESSDEIDTTTSSDIEIISLPTPNGENGQVSPIDPVPLRIALQKTTNWRSSPTHRRTDSSDSSNASKDGGYCELSPGRDNLEEPDYTRSHHEHMEGHKMSSELPALSEEDDNPYHPQRLLKDDQNVEESHDMRSHDQQPDIDKKLADMSKVLQAREDKLLQLSKENCDLMETNSILNNQLKQSEETREAELADVNELTAEFTQRLTEAEKRVTTAIREKEVLKKQLQDAQGELAKRAGDVNLKQVLVDKEEQIAGLLQEGEKLSKSQLQSNTIIKKLRQKEKDNESTLTTQKKKIESQKEELDHLHKVLESKEELEKKQAEAIAQLTSAVNKQEQEMVKLKSEHEDSAEKVRGLQVALDNSYKEMAELHRSNAAQDSKAHEAALSAEMHVREELKMAIEKQQQQHKWEKDSLSMQVEDMRLSMARQEKDHNRREDLLRQEIADLQKQLQEDEARTQELTQGVSLATRPLLRQIENLQSTYNVQSSTWERVEKSLSDRLADTQNQLAIAMEKERTANEQVLDLGSKVTLLETQNSRLRQEKSQMTAQLEMLKTKVEMSEDAKQNEAAQIEVFKQQMSYDMTELKKQKVLLETQLDVEKSKVEQEKKKVNMLQEQMRDLECDLQHSRSRDTPIRGTPSPLHVSISRNESMVDSFHEHSFTAITQEELDRSFVLSSPNGNKQSLYEALRQSGAANLLENLQSQLKLREGEIAHLQGEIRSLERTRESMAKELVDLSNHNDDLEEKVKDLPVIQDQYQDLNQRYNAILQMYGEKVEEANELKLDLQDVKDMYKAQINHLLGQS